jgi:lipopolysaccharide biosynthesis glycosyltransferase
VQSKSIKYIAIGEAEYLKMALASAYSIRSFDEAISIVIETDLATTCTIDDSITLKYIGEIASSQFASRFLKTRLQIETDLTLYLDCDVLAKSSIAAIWDNQPISMGLAFNPVIKGIAKTPEEIYTVDLLPSNFIEFNSGVILLDREKESTQLLAKWANEWDRYRGVDNMALSRAVYHTGSKINILPNQWNSLPVDSCTNTVLTHYVGSFKSRFWLM